MKSLFSMVPMIAAITLAACAPKDSLVVRPDNRAGGFGFDGGGSALTDSNKHLLLLIDRQVEAIHLFKAVMDSNYALKKNLKIEDTKSGSISYKKITSTESNFKNITKLQNSPVNLLAQIELAEDGSFKEMTITENKKEGLVEETLTPEADTKNKELIIKNKSKEIIIKKSATAEATYDASINIIDETNTKSTGKTILINQAQFTFTLNGSDVTITSMTIQHNRYGSQTTDLDMKSVNSSLLVKLGDECTSINGKLDLDSMATRKDKSVLYKKFVTFTDSSASLTTSGKDKLSSSAAACATRPIVNLSVIL